MRKKKGLIIVVSAPSGAGKSTLCNRLLQQLPHGLRYSISCTTRPPRAGERNGEDYFFVNERKFRQMAREGRFVEWACVHGYYYGTPKRHLEATMRAGFDSILDIDVQGAAKIRRAYPQAVMIFIMAPSMKVLEQRLRARKKDSEEVIRRRLANARKELRRMPEYTYLVINDDIARASRELRTIIEAEHLRIRNLPQVKF